MKTNLRLFTRVLELIEVSLRRIFRITLKNRFFGANKIYNPLALENTNSDSSVKLLGIATESLLFIESNPFDNNDGEHFFRSRQFVNVESGIIHVKSGAVYNSARQLVTNSKVSNERQFLLSFGSPFFRFSLNEKQRFIPMGTNGFYHWLIEELPNAIRCLREFPDAIIVIKDDKQEIVKLLNDLNFKFVSTSHSNITHKDISYVGRGDDFGWPHPSDIAILRETISFSYKQGPIKQQKFFLTRRGIRRTPSFIGQIEDHFLNMGFQVVDMGKLAIQEQIDIWAIADVVAGLHGAAFSTIAWARPNTVILEIFESSHVVKCYKRIAQILGLKYESLILDSQSTAEDNLIAISNKLNG